MKNGHLYMTTNPQMVFTFIRLLKRQNKIFSHLVFWLTLSTPTLTTSLSNLLPPPILFPPSEKQCKIFGQ